MDEVFTVYKLIILYILERAEGDVTQAMVSSFLLESGYANFVSLAESYDQLEKRGLVKIVSRGEKTFLHPTDAGRQAFGYGSSYVMAIDGTTDRSRSPLIDALAGSR